MLQLAAAMTIHYPVSGNLSLERLAAEPTICVAESGPRRNRRVGGEAPVLWTLSVYLADRVYTRLPRSCVCVAFA